MTLKTSLAGPRPPRSAYAGAAGVFLVMAVGTFFASLEIARHFGTHPSSTVSAVPVVAQPSASEAPPAPVPNTNSTAALQQKLDADTQRVVEAQKQRKSLLAEVRQCPQRGQEVAQFSTEHATRQQLVSELVLLLRLEKQDKSESSEVQAVRHKIARLQTELAQGDARGQQPQRTPNEEVHAKCIQLGNLRREMESAEADVSTDQKALAASTQLKQPDVPASPPQAAAQVSTTPAAPDSRHASADLLASMIVVSLLLGLACAWAMLVWMTRRANSFCDATLDETLAGRAIFLGSVPRMKMR